MSETRDCPKCGGAMSAIRPLQDELAAWRCAACDKTWFEPPSVARCENIDTWGQRCLREPHDDVDCLFALAPEPPEPPETTPKRDPKPHDACNNCGHPLAWHVRPNPGNDTGCTARGCGCAAFRAATTEGGTRTSHE